MKQLITFGLLIFSSSCFGQTVASKLSTLMTAKYAGTFSYGQDPEKGEVGTIVIYPETDTTILFYVDVNIGAPSYNMGALYGRLRMENDSGTFYKTFDYSERGCKWKFRFLKNDLVIETIEGKYDCGFGYGVLADGTYKRKSNEIATFFEDMEENKIFFKTTSPEEYNKD